MAANGPTTILNPAQIACIDLLESVLASAKKGEIKSVAIVACGDHDFGASSAGPDGAKLNLGLDTLKANILQQITAVTPQRRPGSLLQMPSGPRMR